MRQFNAPVVFNQAVSQGWKLLAFSWPEDLASPFPGQFFTFNPQGLQAGDAGLLRRPLAFAFFGRGLAFALYQIRGKATQALAAFAEGGSLDVIGPLGNSFPRPFSGEQAFLVGGGIGIGPLLYLQSTFFGAAASSTVTDGAAGLGADQGLETIAGRGAQPPSPLATKLFLGFRSAGQVPSFSLAAERWKAQKHCAEGAGRPHKPDSQPLLAGLADLQRCLNQALIATDDGSGGFKGTVVDALLYDADPAAPFATNTRARLYACGPAPMLSALDALALETGISAHLSAEQWMACGVGACQGCVLPAKAGGYLRACADGPIFPQGAILWKA
jgi:dihydroorotate dehydrogenase electron transfer subunit